jgi:hypothetical protein
VKLAPDEIADAANDSRASLFRLMARIGRAIHSDQPHGQFRDDFAAAD